MAEKKKVIKMEDIEAKAGEKKCPVQRSLIFIEEFLEGPMCGRCFPCMMGSYEARIRLRRLVEGSGVEEDIARLRRIASNMLEASMCKRGKDTAKYMVDKIDSGDFSEHIKGVCTEKECRDLIKYIIIPEQCTMCGLCLDACKDNAILGEKKKPYLTGYHPFEIVQKRCTKCGECIKVCPYGAIIIVDVKEKEPVGV